MRPQKKPTTYQHLVQQCRDAEWQTCFFPVQVGCRGFPAVYVGTASSSKDSKKEEGDSWTEVGESAESLLLALE